MKKILFVFAALAVLASCKKEQTLQPDTPETPEVEKLKMNLTLDVVSKVSDAAFDNGDKVGVYVVRYRNTTSPGTLAATGNLYDNVMHTYSTTWTTAQDMYWQDKVTPSDFYCYHPYGSPSNVTAYPFATKQDQTLVANYKASDFVWGKAAGIAPTTELINISTNHIMSNAVIYVKPGKGFTAETFASADIKVGVRNVMYNSLINLSTGKATATGSMGEVKPYKENDHYRAVIVPQTVAAGSQLIVVTVNGVEYALKKGFTFVAGKQHKFTVTVNKTGSGVNVGVGDWEEDTEDNGGDAE